MNFPVKVERRHPDHGNEIGYQGDDSVAVHANTAAISAVNDAEVTLTPICDPDPWDNPVAGDELTFFDENFVYKATARVVSTNWIPCGQLTGGNSVGPGSTDLAIRRNLILTPGQSAQYYGALTFYATDPIGNLLASPVFQKVDIGRNYFVDMPGPAMLLSSAAGLDVRNNWILSGNKQQGSRARLGT